MNQLMLLVVALVIFVYFGGKYVPSVLRQNKEMLLGVVIGLVLCSFMGLRLEGFASPAECREKCPNQSEQCGDQETGYWRERNCELVGGVAESHARGFTYDPVDEVELQEGARGFKYDPANNEKTARRGFGHE